MRRIAVAIALLAGALPALGQPLDRYQSYRQSPAVLAQYPDVSIALESPGLASRDGFTSQQELEDFVAALTAASRHIKLGATGRSQQGRAIPHLFATAEGLADPAAIVALGRPIVWLIGLQHGNEPAGGEAMLAVASALAHGELAPLLEHISVVIVPRANPDGAAAFRRTTANGADPNRDHLLMLLPETRSLHETMRALPPDLVLDAHEFTVANRWIAKFDALQAVDALLLSATHPMVGADLARLADTVFRPRIEDALHAHGLSSFDYYTTGLDSSDKTVSMGGNAPGAARNTFGLAGAVSFLIETRGVGIGRDSFQRRVATHYLAAKAVLATAAAHAAELRTITLAARRSAQNDGREIIVAHKLRTRPVTLPMLDPASGAAKPTPVMFRDSHDAVPTTLRAWPAGYVLLQAGVDAGAFAALRLNDVLLCRVAASADLEAEALAIRARAQNVDRESINPDQAITVAVTRKTIHVPEGATYVPVRQKAGVLAALALEPDSPGSLAGVGLVAPPPGSDELPVYRLAESPRLASCR